MDKQAVIEAFKRVECELSPENLYCDGEISVAEARGKERKLLARRKELVKMLGYEPSFQELWG